jgi:hypothetical protein
MPLFYVIDDDGPARATREALCQPDINLSIQGLGTNGAVTCDAVVADACMLGSNGAAHLRAPAARPSMAHLVTISRAGAIALIQDAPDFRTMAGRLATK